MFKTYNDLIHDGDTLTSDFLKSFHIVRSSDQDLLGDIDSLNGCKVVGLPTLKTTCNAVVMKLLDLDNTSIGKHYAYGDHWGGNSGYTKTQAVMGETYPAHAIINVADSDTAYDVAEYLNLMFKSDRDRFPRASGWHAISTTGNSKPSLSDYDHPFFYYKNFGKMNSRASRILVVVDLACEGLNNKFVNVWGAACNMGSVVKACQRLGRTIRTAAKHGVDRVTVPPMSHDTVYVITHEGFDRTVDTINQAFEFTLHSHSLYGDVTTIDQYIYNDVDFTDVDDDTDANLSVWERFRLISRLGEDISRGRSPKWGSIIKHGVGNSSRRIKSRVAEDWAHSAFTGDSVVSIRDREINARADFMRMCRAIPPAPLDVILMNEKMVFDYMSYEECLQWLSAQKFGDGIGDKGDRDAFVSSINTMKIAIGEAVTKTGMDIREAPITRLENMAAELEANIGHNVFDIVTECAFSLMSKIAPDITIDDFKDEGRLCKPEITYQLRDANFKEAVRGYVIHRLLNEGKLNHIAAVLAA